MQNVPLDRFQSMVEDSEPDKISQIPKAVSLASHLILTSGITAALSTYFLLLPYAHPLWDDFSRTVKARDLGIVRNISSEYFSWSGRWITTTLHYITFGLVDPTEHYGLVLGAFFLAFGFSVFLFFRSVYAGPSSRCEHWLAAGGFLALYWNAHPAPHQTFFWLSGCTEYLLSLAPLLFLLALLIPQRPLNYWGRLLIVFLAITAGGVHELYGILGGLLIFGITFSLWRFGQLRHSHWLLACVSICSSLGLSILAPGNWHRMKYFPHAHDLSATVGLTLTQFSEAMLSWFTDGRLWLAAGILLIFPFSKQTRWSQEYAAFVRRRLPLFSVILLIMAFSIPSFATGLRMAPRVLGGIYFFFLLLGIAHVLFYRDPILDWLKGMRYLWLYPLLSAGLGICLVMSGNTRMAFRDWLGPAKIYDEMMRARYEIAALYRQEGKQAVTFEKISTFPRSFYANADLLEDPKAHRNQWFAKFLGLGAVSVK